MIAKLVIAHFFVVAQTMTLSGLYPSASTNASKLLVKNEALSSLGLAKKLILLNHLLRLHLIIAIQQSKSNPKTTMPALTPLVSTAYGHLSPPTYRDTAAFALFSDVKAFISSFATPNFDLSFFEEWRNGFALSPLLLLEFIAVLIAICLTAVVAVSFISGFGQVRQAHLVLQKGKVPEVFDVYGDETGT